MNRNGHRRSRGRHLLFALVALAGAGLIALAFGEFVARLLYRGPLVTGSLIVADPELGFGLRRGSCGRGVSPEFDVRYCIDRRLGVRIATPDARVPTTADVIVHGDSFVFGHGVEPGDVFTSLLAQQCSGTVLVNAGVFNYGPDQELLWARRVRQQCEAPLEWVCFYEGNDLQDLARFDLLRIAAAGLRQQPPIDAVGSWRRRLTGFWLYPWLCRSWLWSWAKQVLFSRVLAPAAVAPAVAAAAAPDQVQLLVRVYEQWQSEVGADRFLVVLIPARDHFRMRRPEVDRLKHQLRRAGIRFFDPAVTVPATTAAQAQFENNYYKTDPHWNAAGHAWAARCLAPLLQQMTAAVSTTRSAAAVPTGQP